MGVAAHREKGKRQRGDGGDDEFRGEQPQSAGDGAAVRGQGRMAELVTERERAEQPGPERRRGQRQLPRPCGEQTRLWSVTEPRQEYGGEGGRDEYGDACEEPGADPSRAAQFVTQGAQGTGGGPDGDRGREGGRGAGALEAVVELRAP